MSVTLAPELTEAIKASAERQGLSFDEWIVAAAEVKFRADDEAEIFEKAEEERHRKSLLEFLDESFAEHSEPTEEERAAWQRHEEEAVRASVEYYARMEAAGA